MNLFEQLTKSFLIKPKETTLRDLTLNDPQRVSKDLDDIDLSLILQGIDGNGTLTTKQVSYEDLINQYERISSSPEGGEAISEIVNEMFSSLNGSTIRLDLGNLDLQDGLKSKIQGSFEKIMKLLHFNTSGRDHIRDWYKYGIFNVEVIYNNKKLTDGIKSLAILQPQNLFKDLDKQTKETIYHYGDSENTYLSFNARGEIVYKREQIVSISSGLRDLRGRNVGFLHNAIKPYNQMTMIEDILVVYRLTRGTEKRIFKVNVGNLPKAKAMTYMQELISKFAHKKTYNTDDGSVNNDTHLMSLSEDIWLPTKDSTKDIDIDTLNSGMNLGELDDLVYFKEKLYKALNVPASRFSNEGSDLGLTATEITRDEARFLNYVYGLRSKFNKLFIELLRRELVSTKTMNESEFNSIKNNLVFIYPSETDYVEQRRIENLSRKIDVVSDVDEFVGKYVSKKYVYETIFNFTEEEIEDMEKQIKEEISNGVIKVDDDEL